MTSSWQPTASIDALRERAAILRTIRAFFYARNVLEVETPSLSTHTVTDPYLEAMSTKHNKPGVTSSTSLYLQTSPEYAMKRLLAAGSGDIFQLCKAFRDDELGRLHNPEFTMLEWYRVGFDMQALIEELAALLVEVLPVTEVEQFTYCELFERLLNFNPLTIQMSKLLAYCKAHKLGEYAESLQTSMSKTVASFNQLILKDSLLQVIFSQQIEPHIGGSMPVIVTHFPASQASLATLTDSGLTANRFEVYFKGIELANGFNELTDASEQRKRFEQDNAKREALGLSTKIIDSYFLDALSSGLPKCSGVALGVDRLIMLAADKKTINEVISFSHLNC